MKVLISGRAEADLELIYQRLAISCDIKAAERFRSDAERAIEQLRLHPAIGPHPGWATRHPKLRFWVVSRTNYIIYYEVLSDAVSIERVLDGRRDVHRIMELRIEDPPDELV